MPLSWKLCFAPLRIRIPPCGSNGAVSTSVFLSILTLPLVEPTVKLVHSLESHRSASFRRAALGAVMALSMTLPALAETQPTSPAYTARTNGPDQLIVTVTAPPTKSHAPISLHLPAGQIYVTPTGDRIATLRAAAADLGATGNAEITIPCTSLSLRTDSAPDQPVRPTTDSEPKLEPLLKYLATRNDVPRATSECTALALLHDLTFQQWLDVAPAPPPSAEPAPAMAPPPALVQAIDAIGILRQIAPSQTFQLASDPQLKLRALRNPVTRAKALQLYGMTIPGDSAVGQTPPDLGQLLHTKPGDNCPICRMRAQMQAPANDL